MRQIVQRIALFFRRLSAFVQRYGFRCLLVEVVRRMGLDFLCDGLLTTLIPTSKAGRIIAATSAESVAALKVSVIIPVYNGIADGLERLLNSLANQSHRNLEIIAVDSGSTDQSVQLLEQHGAKVIKIRKEEFRHDFARNLGAEHATGDYLLYTVCDCRFEDSKWIELGLRQLRRFSAVSYSTPQSYDQQAELYSQYLAYTFLSANRYSLGVNIFGNRLLGHLAFSLAGMRLRERVVHVDDTNHLVRRDFFQQERYCSHTCEDMRFGMAVIRSGQHFIYSTLSQVRHYHSHKNYKKYFTRIFVDLLAINGFVGRRPVRKYHDVLDMTVSSAAIVLGTALRALRNFERTSITTITLGNDLSPPVGARSIHGQRLINLVETLSSKEPLTCILDMPSLSQETHGILCDQLGLVLDANGRSLDQKCFIAFRDRFVSHLRSACNTLTKLGHGELPLKDFEHFTVLCLISSLASELGFWMFHDLNENSMNGEKLKRLEWV